jgi:hypothetical protein
VRRLRIAFEGFDQELDAESEHRAAANPEMMTSRIQDDRTREDSARTSIGLVTVLVGLVMLGSVTDAMAWGSKGHRIIGLVARELLLPETSAEIETIMGTADLATFGLYLDDNKERLDAEVPGSRAWHYDNIPICGRKRFRRSGDRRLRLFKFGPKDERRECYIDSWRSGGPTLVRSNCHAMKQ